MKVQKSSIVTLKLFGKRVNRNEDTALIHTSHGKHNLVTNKIWFKRFNTDYKQTQVIAVNIKNKGFLQLFSSISDEIEDALVHAAKYSYP